MAALAMNAGGRSRLVLEESARSTWENVAFTADLVAACSQVAYASSPVHAVRARRYLAQQHPELAERLVRADDYRLLESRGLKVATSAYFLYTELMRYGRAGIGARRASGSRR